MLTVKDLTVTFETRNGRTEAVKNASFAVAKGQTLGIVGESGSGKSVACYSLLGLLPTPPARIESGSALFGDVNLLSLSEKQLRKVRGNRISMIFQDPMMCLNPHLTVAQQLMEPLIVHDRLSKKLAKQRAIEALDEVGIHNAGKRVNAYPHEFSGGMRQRVMIAMALIKQPEMLIADEPTTALDVTVQAQILKLIHSLQQNRGLTVLFISHDLAVVSDIAEDIVVMQAGEIVESGAAKKVLSHPSHGYTQKLIAAVPKTEKPEQYKHDGSGKTLLEVDSITKVFAEKAGWFSRSASETVAVDNISLDIRQGEILGLVGESGSGKSTLGRSIMCLEHANKGKILFEGKDMSPLSDGQLLPYRRYFQMVFQDPYASLNPRMTVYQTLEEPLLLHKIVKQADVDHEVKRLMEDVGLHPSMVRKYPHEFSGGQRQRIAIARALALRPKLIVADEPVSALDVTIQAQILKLLMELTLRYQLAMLFISHDLSVVRYISDRIVVMHQGKIVERGETEELFGNPKEDYTKSLLASVASL